MKRKTKPIIYHVILDGALIFCCFAVVAIEIYPSCMSEKNNAHLHQERYIGQFVKPSEMAMKGSSITLAIDSRDFNNFKHQNINA